MNDDWFLHGINGHFGVEAVMDAFEWNGYSVVLSISAEVLLALQTACLPSLQRVQPSGHSHPQRSVHIPCNIFTWHMNSAPPSIESQALPKCPLQSTSRRAQRPVSIPVNLMQRTLIQPLQ